MGNTKKAKNSKLDQILAESMDLIPTPNPEELILNPLDEAQILENRELPPIIEAPPIIETIKHDNSSHTRKLINKYNSYKKMFPEYNFNDVNYNWSYEELENQINSMKQKILNVGSGDHLDIHSKILNGSSKALEYGLSNFVDVKGLNDRVCNNSQICSSSKLLLSEIIDVVAPPNSSSAVKTLITQLLMEIFKSVITNRMTNSLVSQLSNIENKFKEEISKSEE